LEITNLDELGRPGDIIPTDADGRILQIPTDPLLANNPHQLYLDEFGNLLNPYQYNQPPQRAAAPTQQQQQPQPPTTDDKLELATLTNADLDLIIDAIHTINQRTKDYVSLKEQLIRMSNQLDELDREISSIVGILQSHQAQFVNPSLINVVNSQTQPVYENKKPPTPRADRLHAVRAVFE
jgi:hypothetical protein